MMFHIILVFLSYQCSSLPMQAHGFNDLKILKQLLKKGVNTFKMDVSPATREFCEQNHPDTFDPSRCKYLPAKFEYCCLGFRGDTSSTPSLNYPFSSTEQFIKFLNGNKKYFQGIPPYEQPKLIAFNFQYQDPDSELTTDFLYDLFKTIENNHLVLNIYTGSDRVVEGYQQKCQQDCSEKESYIAQAPFYIDTGDYEPNPIGDQNRRRVFNVYYKSIDDYCRKGFPIWIQKYEFPMIFWEPSHQTTIQFVKTRFYDPECDIHPDLRQESRYRIATNLQPEAFILQYQNYVTIEKENNINLKTDKLYIPSNHQYIQLFYSDQETLLVLDQSVKKYNKNWELLEEYTLNQTPLKTFYYSKTLQILNNQNIQQLSFETKDLNLNEIYSSELIENADITISIKEQQILLLTFEDNDDKAKLIIVNQSIKTQKNSQTVSIEIIKRDQILQQIGDAILSDDQYIIVLQQTCPVDGINQIYYTIIYLNKEFKLVKLIESQSNQDYGLVSSIKLYKIKDKIHILEAHQDGICQSGILINNNQWNKCLYHNYKEFTSLLNVTGAINYSWVYQYKKYGFVEDYEYAIQTGTIINACHDRIMHGKLSDGKSPQILLNANDTLEAVVIQKHLPYNEQETLTKVFCGSSQDPADVIEGGGTVIYKYKLVDLIKIQEFE